MYLVTGATGFVGRALIADLRQRQIAFRAVSRKDRPGHITIPTLDSSADWRSALDGIDTVIHLAARVHIMNDTANDPLAAFRAVNVDSTLALARQAAAMGVKTFVFVSSIKVNGEEPADGRTYSADDVPQPTDPYGISKFEAEKALLALAAETGMAVVIIRPPLVYGPGVKANFAAMIRSVKSGLPLPLGRAHNRRSMIYVGNLTDLIIAAAQAPSAANQVFLASDGEDLSVTELLTGLAKACGKPSRLIPVPVFLMRLALTCLGKRQIARRLFSPLQVDIEKTRTTLSWTPPFTVEQGLRKTVEEADV